MFMFQKYLKKIHKTNSVGDASEKKFDLLENNKLYILQSNLIRIL